MDNVLPRYHQTQFSQPTVIVDRSDRIPCFISEILGREEGTTVVASVAEERAPIPYCCAQFARLWGTATPLHHIHSLHSQASYSSLQLEQTYPSSALQAHEISDNLLKGLEMRINRDIENLLREDAIADTEHTGTLASRNMFHYGSDPAEQELKKTREEHAKECAHVDSVALDLNKRYAEDAEILKYLFEKLRELEQ